MYLYLLTGITCSLATFLFIKIYIEKADEKDYETQRLSNSGNKCHCNYCKQSFILDSEQGYRFCPYCGNELDYFKEL